MAKRTDLSPSEGHNPSPLTNDLWERLELEVPSEQTLRRQKIMLRPSSGSAAAPIALLRTQILQAMKTHGFDTFAVASPAPQSGASFLAMNLAFSMARQKNLRVLLLDLNLGEPSLARRLAVPDSVEAFKAIGGNVDTPGKVVRLGENLALGYNTSAIHDASERLQDTSEGGIIDQFRQALRPDVIICDTPAILSSDDLVALAPQLGGVLLVIDGQSTKPNELSAAETLIEGRTKLIGVVLNRGAGV